MQHSPSEPVSIGEINIAFGRPLKGRTRRVPITVHASVGTLDIIDDYVEKRKTEQERQYSRSDFWNEAASMYMKHLGIAPEEDEE